MPLNSKDENVYAIFFLLEQQYCHPNHVGVILWFFLRFSLRLSEKQRQLF